MSSQHQTCDVSDGETKSVGIDPYVTMCGLAVYLYFDSLVWLAVDKQVQEGNNTVGFLFVSEFAWTEMVERTAYWQPMTIF